MKSNGLCLNNMTDEIYQDSPISEHTNDYVPNESNINENVTFDREINKGIDFDNEAVNEDLLLIENILAGDVESRKKLSKRIHPMIMATNQRICKSLCKNNRYEFKCTIDDSWSKNSTESLFCEWGNASYAWILDDLSNNKRLKNFKGTNGAIIEAYLGTIVHSSSFLQRWREWRFGRRIKVPQYIKEIDEYASKIFFKILEKDTVPNIAQQFNLAEDRVKQIKDSIIITLTQRGRLHVLDSPEFISLDVENDEPYRSVNGFDLQNLPLSSFDLSIDQHEDREKLNQGWESLTAEERFVLEAMKIDEQDAKAVLKTLKFLKISIKKGVSPEDTNEQQLYYFMRKTWKKLTLNSGLLTSH